MADALPQSYCRRLLQRLKVATGIWHVEGKPDLRFTSGRRIWEIGAAICAGDHGKKCPCWTPASSASEEQLHGVIR